MDSSASIRLRERRLTEVRRAPHRRVLRGDHPGMASAPESTGAPSFARAAWWAACTRSRIPRRLSPSRDRGRGREAPVPLRVVTAEVGTKPCPFVVILWFAGANLHITPARWPSEPKHGRHAPRRSSRGPRRNESSHVRPQASMTPERSIPGQRPGFSRIRHGLSRHTEALPPGNRTMPRHRTVPRGRWPDRRGGRASRLCWTSRPRRDRGRGRGNGVGIGSRADFVARFRALPLRRSDSTADFRALLH
jgi:hypothetical protein